MQQLPERPEGSLQSLPRLRVSFVALSAIKAGYDVYAVIDSSGTRSKLVQEVSVACMVQPVSPR